MKNKRILASTCSAVLALMMATTSFAAGWTKDNGTWKYLNSRNEYVTDSWQKSGDKSFYLGSDGNMVVNALIETGDNVYGVDENGAMLVNTWGKFNSDDDDQAHWYYFTSTGRAKKEGWETINGKKYHFTDYKMDENWIKVNNDTYFLNDAHDGTYGSVVTGWKYVTNVDEDNSNTPSKEGWYYFDTNGKMVYGKEKKIGNYYYAFDDEGLMQDNWVGMQKASGSNLTYKFYNTSNGDRAEGWKYLPEMDEEDGLATQEGWYFFRNGIPYTASNKTTVINNGYGVVKINGKVYCFDNLGKMVTGKVDSSDPGKYYYFDDKNGDMKYGKVRLTNSDDLDDNDYYFAENGVIGKKGESFTGVHKNYLYDHGVLVRADDNRYMIATVNGKNYLVNKTGKVVGKGTYKDSDDNVKYIVNVDANGNYTIKTEKY